MVSDKKRNDHMGGITHLGIAVKNIQKSLEAICKTLDLPLPPIRDVPERKIKVAVIEIEGIELEYMEDYSDNGRIAEIVRQKGDCITHFCLLTSDIEEDIKILKSRGVEMEDEVPRIGLLGKRIAYTKPSALIGIRLEILEP